jgi:ABC-type transport system involved in multi-copper enzyme maturation permease subunit
MTFVALLTKELRLRLRRERTMWVIIIYILLMGLLGWFYISRFSNINGYNNLSLSDAGLNLYILLSQVQLFLIIFITPAFTSTTINGEKERQTFDLLLCSRLSAFSLVSGKLVAGLVNAFLLIAASVPIFSLVFFFGGVAPAQVASALLVYSITAIMIGTFGLFCSTIVSRPAVSTAVTYMSGILWMIMPIIIYLIVLSSGGYQGSSQPPIMFIWNPVVALLSTYPSNSTMFYRIGTENISPWIAYILLSIVGTIVLFLLSVWTVKPNMAVRLRAFRQKNTTQRNAAATL